MIVTPELNQFGEMSELIWKCFYANEANFYTPLGVEEFRSRTTVASLQLEYLNESVRYYTEMDGDMKGVIAVKGNKIALLFIKNDERKKGYGKMLLRHALEQMDCEDVVLDSSVNAVSFYEKHGFKKCGDKKDENGIVSYPMTGKRLAVLATL